MEETVRQRVSVIASLGTMALLLVLAAKTYAWFSDFSRNRFRIEAGESSAPQAPDPAPRIWPEVVKDLESAKSMTVYSLSPGWTGEGSRTLDGLTIFEGYPVLGLAKVKAPKRIRSLARALAQEVRFGEPWFGCFFPRHGVRADLPDGRRINLVICYQCDQIQISGAANAVVHPGRPSKEALDGILRSAGIDLDDPRRNPVFLKGSS